MSDVEQWEHDEQRAMETEIISLREQVEKLTKERDIKEHCITQFELEDLRMKEQLAALAEQNAKMREALVDCEQALDECRDYPITYDSVIEALSLPDLANSRENKLIAEDVSRQLAALAEQNEKLKDAIQMVLDDAEECTDHDGWTAMLLSLEAYHSADTTINGCDSDLASPVLNRIRADGMKEAFLLYSPDDTAQDWVDKILARADELEKTNG